MRNRTNALLVVAIVIALFSAIQMLLLIGPPPWPRINDLWINAHRAQVQLLILYVAVALGATLLLALPRFGRRRARWAALALWLCATGIVMQWCWPTAVIVTRVVVDHSL